MSLYPVTKAFIWQMVEHERSHGGPFTLQGAIASYLYDLITGSEMSQRNYVKVWRWSYKKVRMNWAQITDTAALIYENGEGRNWGALRAQNGAIPEQNEGIGAHEGRTRGAHLQSTNNISIPKTSDIPPPPADLEDTYAGERPDPDAVDLSFLWGDDLNHESGVRKALREFSHPSPPELIRTLWGRRGRADFSSLAQLATKHGWPVFVAAAVITTNEATHPGLNFLTKVCKRLTEQRNGHATKPAPTPARRPEPPGARTPDRADRNTGYNALLLGSSAASAARGTDGPGGSAAPVSAGPHGSQLRRVV